MVAQLMSPAFSVSPCLRVRSLRSFLLSLRRRLRFLHRLRRFGRLVARVAQPRVGVGTRHLRVTAVHEAQESAQARTACDGHAGSMPRSDDQEA